MASPGLQNKLIVSPPAAQRGKCFPSEGMLTINSSRALLPGSGPSRAKAGSVLGAPHPSSPSPSHPPWQCWLRSPKAGLGKDPFNLPSARSPLSYTFHYFFSPCFLGLLCRLPAVLRSGLQPWPAQP